MKEKFTEIYATDAWTNGSGPGSNPAICRPYMDALQAYLNEHRPKKVVDLGCGDWQFSQFIDWGKSQYIGVDIVDSVIEANTEKYARKGVKFVSANILDFEIPAGTDLVLCRDVLMHLPNEAIIALWERIKDVPQVWLTADGRHGVQNVNQDIEPGQWRRLDLNAPPFDFGLTQLLNYDNGKRIWAKQ